ncbi:MAG: nitrile hydratase subunit beta [Hyphomicrobiaceae bacterium]
MSSAPMALSARFGIGDAVRIDDRPAIGHCRSPWYLRGRVGEVVGVQGCYRDPERLAYHRPGLPARVLYKVRFSQRDLWPDYSGDAGDRLEADIYEHWLSPVMEQADA